MADALCYVPGNSAITDKSIINEFQRERAALEIAFARLERWAGAGNAQMKFAQSAYDGIAGGDAVVVEVVVADGGGVPNPFALAAGVTVTADGSAVIVETMPVQFIRVMTDDSESYKATVHVTDAVAEVVNLALVDSEGTGLSVISVATVTFA